VTLEDGTHSEQLIIAAAASTRIKIFLTHFITIMADYRLHKILHHFYPNTCAIQQTES